MALITEEFSDRVGIFTILIDAERDRDTAKQITESIDAPFITICENESVYEAIGMLFTSGYIPETLLFDGDGNILESIVGGSPDEYRTAIKKALSN